MLNMVTDKRPNGRRLLILVLEPQDMDHIRKGQVTVANTAQVEGVDVMVSYCPDGARLAEMLQQEMKNMRPDTFQRLMTLAQQYPEVRRKIQPQNIDLGRTKPI